MRAIILGLALIAGSCRDQKPPTPTKEQSARLNEAEDMLNAQANEEGPADRSTGPSNSTD